MPDYRPKTTRNEERLALIKERYQRLIVRSRIEMARELALGPDEHERDRELIEPEEESDRG